MDGNARPQYRRQRRAGPRRDGSGYGHGRGGGGGVGDTGSLAGRTTVRAAVALGTYVVQDLRDVEGLTRPMLRRSALRMAASRRGVLRRIGAAYLRADPPSEKELLAGRPEALSAGPAQSEDEAEVIDVAPDDVEEVI
jgi:hypothetical protein